VNATVDELTREAEQSAEARGHRLAGWRSNSGVGWSHQFEASCLDCGAYAIVEPTPAPNSVSVAGTVYAWNCDGGARRRQHDGWAGTAWEPVAYTHDGSAYCVGCTFERFSPESTAGEGDHVADCGRVAPVVPVFSSDREALADSVCGGCREAAWA